MMRACGMATTLCPLISMMRCPTRMPPRSAMPPRRRLQIWRGQGLCCSRGHAQGWPPRVWALGGGLTIPSSTQKPSCSRACGRWMMAVVTGGQWTMLRVTDVCDFTSCAGWGLLAWRGLQGATGTLGERQPPLGLSLPPGVKWRLGDKALNFGSPREKWLGTQISRAASRWEPCDP